VRESVISDNWLSNESRLHLMFTFVKCNKTFVKCNKKNARHGVCSKMSK